MLARQSTAADIRKRDVEACDFCPLDPGLEVQGCSVSCTIGMWDIAPLVFILAAGRSMGFL